MHILNPCSLVYTQQRTEDDLLKTKALTYQLQRLGLDELLQAAKLPRKHLRVVLRSPQFCSGYLKAIGKILVLKNPDRLTCINIKKEGVQKHSQNFNDYTLIYHESINR